MKPSDFQKTVQCRFESCLKKVVRHVVKDYQQKLKRRQEKETLFCELPEIVVENLAVWDDYETDYTIFNVCGYDIRVYDDELAEALRKLQSAQKNPVNKICLLLVFSVPTERAAIATGNDLRGLGICHQQAFSRNSGNGISAKYAILRKIALLASSFKSFWQRICLQLPH